MPTYAIRAFNFPTAGYLLKPIDEIELAVALDRAIGRIQQRRKANNNNGNILNSRIGIPDNKSVNYIPIRDILYLEAFNTYTKIHTTSGRQITSAYNLGKFRELLPDTFFYQIHRSFIVNLDHTIRYDNVGILVLDMVQNCLYQKLPAHNCLRILLKIRGPDRPNVLQPTLVTKP